MRKDNRLPSQPKGVYRGKNWPEYNAGIDIWTTLGVEHLEGLNDIVESITGVHVRETVPDRIFDEADEVVVVDLPVDELLRRWQEDGTHQPIWGSLPESHDSSPKGKLLALRELPLRRTADRADSAMQAYRVSSTQAPAW
jgi:two-component system sensor histidine kinase KdpD